MSRILAIVGVCIGLLGVALGLNHGSVSAPATQKAVPPAAVSVPTANADLSYDRLEHPGRTVVRLRSRGVVVATLTDGARTAVLPGPARTFADPKFTDATVRSTTWVRLLPHAWTPGSEAEPWFRSWLDRESASTEPDALAIAAGYLDDEPEVRDEKGVRFQGDAAFGPKSHPSATLGETGSDFYDFLGTDWTFPDGDAEAEPKRYGAVDCSGFVRLVFGYRMGLPLLNVDEPGPGLPRRSFAIAEFAAGAVIVPNTHRRAKDYDRLQPGDLVFFDLDGGPQIDHSGIYLGRDDAGHHRVISSRKRADGPTLGDVGGTSLLDGGGFYSMAFRTAKRL